MKSVYSSLSEFKKRYTLVMNYCENMEIWQKAYHEAIPWDFDECARSIRRIMESGLLS